MEAIAKQFGVTHKTISKDLDGFVPPVQTPRPKGGRPFLFCLDRFCEPQPKIPMKQSDIAKVIERDLLRTDTGQPAIDITKCFACGYSMVYRGTRFCSERCRDWFDTGNPSFEDQRSPIVYRWRDGRVMPAGRYGFHITCAGCQKEFESLGLRCCSPDCERHYREHQDNLATMAEVGIEVAPKKQCAAPGCSATIPKWRNGRAVRSDTRFCSPKCANRAK